MLYEVTLATINYDTGKHNRFNVTVFAEDEIEALYLALIDNPNADYTYSVRAL